MEDIKKPEIFYFNKESFKEPQYAGDSPFVRYSSYVDLKQSKTNLISDNKAVVDKLVNELDRAKKVNHIMRTSIRGHNEKEETMQNKIDELENISIKLFKNECCYFLSEKTKTSKEKSMDIIESWHDKKEWLELIKEDINAEDYIDEEISNWG